ncbi:MAG TPA: response regulator [Desulfopila sp.]|nr:response regulator [Desulfopila sp.]
MDDEEIVADIAEQMLSYLGYQAVVVGGGEEAVRLYREAYEQDDPFSLVILDLNIPRGMGGQEAVGHILEIDPAAKVLVSSGYSSDIIMQEYSSYGFSGCIAKPFDLKGLQDVLDKALR